MIILRDGDVGEPKILLSPLSYVWTHAARIEAFSGSADPDGHLDDLLMAIATALTADPTLGGLVDLIDVATAQTHFICQVVVAPGWMLHIEKDCDSVLERFDAGSRWERHLLGFYRHAA